MQQYSPDWDDERVIEWDGKFRDDGALMIACCERNVDVGEYRRVLQQARLPRPRQPRPTNGICVAITVIN